jgi:hypothetical protein
VKLHDGNQSVLVSDLGDPAGKLRVPDESVTTDEHVVARGPVDQRVGSAELEVATRRLSGIELHRVLGGDLAKVCLCNSADVAAVQNADVTGSAPVPEICQYEHFERFPTVFNSTYFLPLFLKPW